MAKTVRGEVNLNCKKANMAFDNSASSTSHQKGEKEMSQSCQKLIKTLSDINHGLIDALDCNLLFNLQYLFSLVLTFAQSN